MNINTRVCALCNFSAEPNTREINLRVDDILTVTQTDTDDNNGWLEGTNSRGETGLFPENYVELYNFTSSFENATPKIALLQGDITQNEEPLQSTFDNVKQPTELLPGDITQNNEQLQITNDSEDYCDDNYDSDWNYYSEDEETDNSSQLPKSLQQNPEKQQNESSQPFDNTEEITSQLSLNSITTASNLVDADENNISASKNDKPFLAITKDVFRYHWKPNCDEFNLIVAFTDMNIIYQLTPSFANIPAPRQYNHFHWLYEQLVESFSLLPIPTVPDAKRYDDEIYFEQHRLQLQNFINWIFKHPVLSKSDAFYLFLTSTDDVLQSKMMDKSRNTTTRRLSLVGLSQFAAIYHPNKQMLQSEIDCEVNKCEQFVIEMNGAVKSMIIILNEQTKHFQWKNYFQKIGKSLSKLTLSLDYDEYRIVTNVNLANSISEASDTFLSIGQSFDDVKTKYHWIPLINKLHLYRGILAAYPSVFTTYRNCVKLKRESERLPVARKISDSEMKKINRRTDTMSYAVLAEINYFRADRESNFREVMKNLLASQIDFYQNIVVKLQAAQELFE